MGPDVLCGVTRSLACSRGIGSILYNDQSMAPTPGPVEHFVYNAVGHTVALTDEAGAVTQASLFEAFGQTVAQAGGSDNNRLANTKERDGSLGLDNVPATRAAFFARGGGGGDNATS